MRVVLDTNIVISGFFWGGNPRRILEYARSEEIYLFTTQPLLDELEDVIGRSKFKHRLAQANSTPAQFIQKYTALIELVAPATILPTITDDPDDDAVLACAVAARADVIVSGDHHLLKLGSFRDMPIYSAFQFITFLTR